MSADVPLCHQLPDSADEPERAPRCVWGGAKGCVRCEVCYGWPNSEREEEEW